MLRRFLLLAHRVPPRGEFSLNDLAGGAGRMDEVARAVSTAFTLSNELRQDTVVTILFTALPPPGSRRIELTGSRLRDLNPDERSTAALLKNALVRVADDPRELDASPGLHVGPVDPEAYLRAFLARPGASWLVEDGLPLSSWEPPGEEAALVVSDPYDPTDAERSLLTESGVPRLSVGPRSLRTSQVIDAVHRELDVRDARSKAPTPGSARAPSAER